ncbi:MAG: hybrid sensor histidine kinase/response regulator [Flavobacteriaceae bacterium]|nr:MAG: hybrid sensor histidine kinase/response regulator [Flavobacteriaceae bacterium]
MNYKYPHIIIKNLLLLWVLILPVLNLHSQEETTAKKDLPSYFIEAISFKNQNKLDTALETLNEAAKLAESNEDVKGLIDCYHKIALVYLDMWDSKTSTFYWDRAKVLLRDIEYRFGNATHRYIEAIFLYNSGNNFQSIYLLNSAKELSNDRNLLNNIILVEAHIYSDLEKYENASKNYHSLIVNNDIYEKDFLATQAYFGLARMNLKADLLEESVKNGVNALNLAEANNFYNEIKEANAFLSTTYEKMDRFETALIHNKKLMALDSIFTIEKINTEERIALKIKDDFQTEEIARLELKNLELSESANRSEITVILTSAFLTIISILALSLYRNNQIKLKTNDLLYTKNRELQIARDSAVQGMKAKANFLSTVSHELRTPLYAVTGLTHLLLEENPKESQKEHLKSLKFSGDYLLNFINDILQINKIDADKAEALNVEFKLKKVLEDVIASLKQSAVKNKTKIILEFDKEIPIVLVSDPMKLSQIFMNLVGNSIKFTKGGEVKVIARLMKKEAEDVTVYFEIKDTGIGISEEKQKNIFDSFEQGSIQINREYGGTGLGLAIVKSLLGLFGSEIQLESELDKGSSFFFQLNLKSKSGAIVNTPQSELTIKDHDLKGLHILVVEDNKINQVITKKMLSKKEITCDIANNGNEAIDLTEKNKYDAILMDNHMPGISGIEATIQIRLFDKETPIIALTAISLDDSLDSFYEAGCNDVVTKPFKPEVFYQKIGDNIFENKNKEATSS